MYKKWLGTMSRSVGFETHARGQHEPILATLFIRSTNPQSVEAEANLPNCLPIKRLQTRCHPKLKMSHSPNRDVGSLQ
ncbi:unnamed protein product [Protopolystoma xenopodis]|uniref:Uncharacterized protein n=1 Tax=Protopolystoma xenopodis TaxID=117903 RepID=A0A448X0L9_9PLAT|nr:unnamed protein product [Protopolystoma xenopodis]